MVAATWPRHPTTAVISSPFFLPCPSPSPRRTVTLTRAIYRISIKARYSLSSPRPLAKRKNHLRPKLLRTLRTDPHPQNTPSPQTLTDDFFQTLTEEPLTGRQLIVLPSYGVSTSHLLVLEEEEVSEAVYQVEGFDNLPPAAATHHDVPRLLLELSLYFVALLAVQTACAVWLFGGANLEDTAVINGGKLGDLSLMGGDQKESSGGDGLEFEKKVSEIRSMAREARASEAQGENEEVGIREEVNQGLGTLRKSISKVLLERNEIPNSGVGKKGRNSNARRRPGLANSANKTRNIPKGFNSSKTNTAPVEDLTNGGIRKFYYDGSLKESLKPHEIRKSNAYGSDKTERFAGPKDLTVTHPRDCSGDPKVVSQETIEKSESDHGTSLSEIRNGSKSHEGSVECSSLAEGQSFEQAIISQDASRVKTVVRDMGDPMIQKSSMQCQTSLTLLGNGDASYEQGLLNKEVDKKPVLSVAARKEDARNQLWWLKLPYVLAICLRRGSYREGFKGLYSLKMGADSDDDNTKLTVAFQDRGDATNFCYLLESFFEDLDDFSADIIPLSIQELFEAVNSGALKAIVLKKGQLQLYAGQPLAEVEMMLCSMFG